MPQNDWTWTSTTTANSSWTEVFTSSPDDTVQEESAINWYTDMLYGTWEVVEPYTDHNGHVYNDPRNSRIQRRLYNAFYYDEPAEYVAYRHRMPSVNATLWAIMQRVDQALDDHIDGVVRERIQTEYGHIELSPDQDHYVQPVDPTEDGEHSQWCECRECSPCECGDYHCEECYPDGPPDYCDCGNCRVEGYDDMDDDDGYTAIFPSIPDETPGRCRFGVELEFNGGDRHYITQEMMRSGIACMDSGYTHEVVRYWKMTTDSSVTGGELVSPIMAGDDDSIEQVREVTRIIKRNGGVTARNVGLHVHLDVTPFRTSQLKALATNLQLVENMLASFVPEHRYSDDSPNEYGARLLSDHSWEAIHGWIATVNLDERRRNHDNRVAACPADRYSSFNFNSLMTYGTIEVRLLGHTLNTIKIRTWIRVLQSVIEASRRRRRIPSGVDGLTYLKEVGLETEYADHFRTVAEGRGNAAHLIIA